MTRPVSTERTNSLALHLGDVLTDIAAFFTPGGSEQAAEQPCQEPVEALMICSTHIEAI